MAATFERPSVTTELLFGAKLLLARPAPVRALWPGAIVGALAVTIVLPVPPRSAWPPPADGDLG